MNDPGQQIALVSVAILTGAIGIALPIQTLWRLRAREGRRDEQLAANAQPRLTALSRGFAAILGVGGAVGCALGAAAGFPFLWAPAVFGAGIFVSAVISAVVEFRVPPIPTDDARSLPATPPDDQSSGRREKENRRRQPNRQPVRVIGEHEGSSQRDETQPRASPHQ